MEKKLAFIGVRLRDWEAKAARQAAEQAGVSVSEFTRAALMRAIAQEFPQGAPIAPPELATTACANPQRT